MTIIYKHYKTALESRDDSLSSEALVANELTRLLNDIAEFEIENSKIVQVRFKNHYRISTNARNASELLRALADFIDEQ
ncbi:hypothetical protein [Streptococcus anginosus]|jgi:hypothetical protein|uniref:hypothetical protein n=1 Tax=Streptococcus anginosus TaxID=1328 RepID=UPI0020006A81|nr:hypothetical protein [Streptococcus anginosus]